MQVGLFEHYCRACYCENIVGCGNWDVAYDKNMTR